MLMTDPDIVEVFEAYYDCRKHKRNTQSAINFEIDLEHNLMSLYKQLNDGSYKIGKSVCFVVTKPKIREVWAANFRDRIVHHLLYRRVKNRFYKTFIYDTFACLPGKGTLSAVNRACEFMRSCSHNYSKKTYYMKIDVNNFFNSIDKDIMFEILSKKILDPWWLSLTKQILYHDPTKDFYNKTPHLLNLVPPHKSLFTAKKNCGIPIGNLSSQFFANVYLNEVDQYVKHILKKKYFVRYMDDMLFFSQNPKTLNQIAKKIDTFLQEKLNLKLHPNKTKINIINNGFDFVGYTVHPYIKQIKISTLKNLNRKLNGLDPVADKEKFRAVVNSYLGMMKHTNDYKKKLKLRDRLFEMGVEVDENITKIVLQKARKRPKKLSPNQKQRSEEKTQNQTKPLF